MKTFLISGVLLCLVACAEQRPSTVEESSATAVVTQSIVLADIPSGSAIRAAGDGSFYIVSDDAPYVYRVSRGGRALDSIHVIPGNNLHRIPKDDKLDDEAAVIADVAGRKCLIAFGSGSHSAARDSMAVIPLGDVASQRLYSLAHFYERVRSTVGIARENFNIEGAALERDRLVLLNRGTDHLIYIPFRLFLDEVVNGRAQVVPISAARVKLPANDSFPPGFSDAVFLGANRLLFCASAEATTNWHADGEVLGSYIGLLDLANPAKPRLLSFSSLVDEDGKAVKDKLEGIEFVRNKDGAIYEIIGVVDNDDGTSKLLHIQLIDWEK